MVKDKPGKRASSKRLIGFLGVVLVIIVVVLAGSLIYGRVTLDKALTRINIDENERFDYLVEDAKIYNQIIKNTKLMTFDTSFDYSKNLKLIKANGQLINQEMDSRQEDCERQSRRFQVELNVFSRLADRQKHDAILKAIKLIPPHSDDECENIEGLRSHSLFINDLDRVGSEIKKIEDSDYQDSSTIEWMARFSDGTYKVAHMDQVKAFYGDSMEARINDRLRGYGLFYDNYRASISGDSELTLSTYNELAAANKKAKESFMASQKEGEQKDKAEDKAVLQADIELYNLLTALNQSPQETQFSNGVWVANVMISSIRSFGNDTDKYPQTSDINELARILKTAGHLDGVEPKLDDLGYKASADNAYALSFKNEATGVDYTFVSGGY